MSHYSTNDAGWASTPLYPVDEIENMFKHMNLYEDQLGIRAGAPYTHISKKRRRKKDEGKYNLPTNVGKKNLAPSISIFNIGLN